MSKIAYLFVLLFFISCNTVEDSLVGKYDLVIIESQNDNKKWQQANWMRNSIGHLHYYPNDTVTVNFTPENFGVEETEPYWYVATYKVNFDSSYVEHTRLRHSNPEEIGKTVKRYFEIKGDTFIMHAKEFGFRLKWLKRDE